MFLRVLSTCFIVLLCSNFSFAETQPIFAPTQIGVSDFGWSSATDGQTLVVGAKSENSDAGGVYVYERNDTNWDFVIRLESISIDPTGELFGYSVGVDGDTIVVGAKNYNNDQGAIYIFVKDPASGWDVNPTRFVAESDYFGRYVAIDNDTIVAGCPYENNDQGAVYVYEKESNTWSFKQKLEDSDGKGSDDQPQNIDGDRLGWSVAIDGDIIAAGACYDEVGSNRRQGSVCVFRRSGGNWSQPAGEKLTASIGEELDWFAYDVAVSGDVIAAGSPYHDNGEGISRGCILIFRWDENQWVEGAPLVSPVEHSGAPMFGRRLSLDGDKLATGDYYCDGFTGSAFLFEWDGSSWSDGTELVPGGVAEGDRLGCSVAISGNVAVAGAYKVDGDVADVGAVYAISLVEKVFNEFQVNTYSGMQQFMPVLASNRQGEFIAVWQSKYTTDATLWYDVCAQRYDKYGRKIGDEFIVNQTRYHGQDFPQIAMRDDGSFIVIWESYTEGGIMEDVYGRLYDADCNPLTNEFRINTVRNSRQMDADVAFNEYGEFMVVWRSFHDAYDPVRYWEVRARIFNADGTPKTVDMSITNDYSVSNPKVITNGKGGYFIIYNDSGYDLYAAEYNGAGGFVSPAHLLVELKGTGGCDAYIDLSDNSIALVYIKSPRTNSEFLNVCAKKFDSLFNEIVPETILNDPNVFRCGAASIDQFSNGDYVVTWTRRGDYYNKYDDCFVRRFSSSFEPLEGQQAVNKVHSPQADSTFYISTSDVSVIGADLYAVAWAFNTGDDDMDIMAAIGPKTYLGDFDFSGQVDIVDLAMLAERWLSDEPVLDIAPEGGDGIINLLDYSKLFEQGLYTWTSSADFDRSGKVDILDLTKMAEGWLGNDAVLDIAPEGGDGVINLLDFSVLSDQF